MVLDPIPQSLPVHFFGSRPQPPTSRKSSIEHPVAEMCVLQCGVVVRVLLQCCCSCDEQGAKHPVDRLNVLRCGALQCIFRYRFSKVDSLMTSYKELGTEWRRPTGCLKLHVSFRKTAINYSTFLPKITHKLEAKLIPTVVFYSKSSCK